MDDLKNEILAWMLRVERGEAELIEVIDMKRTPQQRSSYWLWLTQLAEAINDAGITMEEIVIKLPKRASKENLHILCAKPMMTALFPEITSTEDPNFTTTMQQEVYQWVDQAIAERVGVHVEWPSEESLSEAQR